MAVQMHCGNQRVVGSKQVCRSHRVAQEIAPSETPHWNLARLLLLHLFLLLYYFFCLCRRHREKLQAHFSDGRSLRDCSINASGLMSKSASRLQYSLQFQKVRLRLLMIRSPSHFVVSAVITSVFPENAAPDRKIYDGCLNKFSTFAHSGMWHRPERQGGNYGLNWAHHLF